MVPGCNRRKQGRGTAGVLLEERGLRSRRVAAAAGCNVEPRRYIAFPISPARNHSTEGWPSGLRRTLGKRVYGKPYRGFESHSLRTITNNLLINHRNFWQIV